MLVVLLGLPLGLLTADLGWALAMVGFVEPAHGLRIGDWENVALTIFFPGTATFMTVAVEELLGGPGDDRQ